MGDVKGTLDAFIEMELEFLRMNIRHSQCWAGHWTWTLDNRCPIQSNLLDQKVLDTGHCVTFKVVYSHMISCQSNCNILISYIISIRVLSYLNYLSLLLNHILKSFLVILFLINNMLYNLFFINYIIV